MRIREQSWRKGSPNPRKHVALPRNTPVKAFQASDSSQDFG
jgi:hypothetical protein